MNFKSVIREDWFREIEQKYLTAEMKEEFICPLCSSKLVKKYEGWACKRSGCILYFKLKKGWVYLDGKKKNNLQFFKDKYDFNIKSFENRKRWLRLKVEVFNERGRNCEICKEIINLNVHHIIPISEEPMLSFDKENLMILCENCHIEIHKGDKYKFSKKWKK